MVKASSIQIDGVAMSLSNTEISYLDCDNGFRVFGLAGINQVAMFLCAGLASIGATSQKVYYEWAQEVQYEYESDGDMLDETMLYEEEKEGFSGGEDGDPEQDDKSSDEKMTISDSQRGTTEDRNNSWIDRQVNNETCPPKSNLLECHLYISHS